MLTCWYIYFVTVSVLNKAKEKHEGIKECGVHDELERLKELEERRVHHNCPDQHLIGFFHYHFIVTSETLN